MSKKNIENKLTHLFNSIATMYYFVYNINTMNENMSRQTPNDNRRVRWR